MKKIFTIVAAFMLTMGTFAQAPQKMSYQTVIRDAGNTLVASTSVGIQISVLQGSASGTAVFVETHTPTTNANGLASLEIGNGTPVTGTFAGIDWSAGPYFIKTETDPLGGTAYTISGTSELVSVPYALFSANGTPGPIGPVGPTGANGNDGTNGVDGATGANGADGATGAMGLVGATGANGTTGATGAMGLVGATGANGTTGATGANGTDGATGANGTAGATGAVGATGATGATGAVGPTGPGSVAGTINYVSKFTGATALGNSQIQDNGTNVAVNMAPSLLYRFYVYNMQLTATGDGQSTLYGYRTRDSQNDGTGYSQNTSNDATRGYNFWGDVYTFGVGGWNYNDYNRCGGTFGAEVNGTYWGSLGYKSSGSLSYGVYGSAAYASGAGLVPTSASAGIGGGFFGTIGSMSKGSVVGQFNAGELFAAYNMGDVYTSGKNIELVSTNNSVVPAYSVTSTEAVVYKKGKITLVNGTATVSFDENYSQLLGESPIVTITPVGECNGVYIASVSKTGFVVKELNGGTSNVEINWIAAGDRVDATSTEVPSFLKTTEFNAGLDKVLFNDGNKSQSGEGFWWDGTKFQFNTNYPSSINPSREEKTRMLEAQKH